MKVLSFLVPASWISAFVLGVAGFGDKIAATAKGEVYSTNPWLYVSLAVAVLATAVAFCKYKD